MLTLIVQPKLIYLITEEFSKCLDIYSEDENQKLILINAQAQCKAFK